MMDEALLLVSEVCPPFFRLRIMKHHHRVDGSTWQDPDRNKQNRESWVLDAGAFVPSQVASCDVETLRSPEHSPRPAALIKPPATCRRVQV